MITLDQLLIFAVCGRKLDLVRERLAAEADSSYIDSAHGTALFVAIQTGQVEMIHLLMEHGANIHVGSESSYGALEFALRNGNFAVIETVLRYGAVLRVHRSHWREALQHHFLLKGKR